MADNEGADKEGEGFDFGDLGTPEGEGLDFNELIAPEEEKAVAPAEGEEGQAAEAEAAESAEPTEPIKEGQEEVAKEPTPSKMPVYLERGGVIGIPVILLVLFLGLFALNVVSLATAISTALYIIAVGLVGYGVWKCLATSTVYTMLLACALVAVLTAVFYLVLELNRYGWDVKARSAKHRVSMSQSVPAAFLVKAD